MTGHYTSAWLLWIGSFFVIEVAALVFHRGQGFTLSEHVWSWFAISGDKPPLWRLRRVMLIAFLGWISLHFLTGGQF